MKTEKPIYIGKLTMPKDRAMYRDAVGQAFVMTEDMSSEFEDLLTQQGHEIYGKIIDVDRDITHFRERADKLVGARVTGILIAIPEFSAASNWEMYDDMGALQLPALE